MGANEKQARNFTIGELAEFVAAEVEQILVRYDTRMPKTTVVTGGRFAGAVVAAFAALSLNQQRALNGMKDEIRNEASQLAVSIARTAVARTRQSAVEDVFPTELEQPAQSISIKVDDWAGPTAGPTYLETTFGISRSTLHRWQRRNAVIALRTGGRKHVFPLAQFVDGRPANGIAQISALIPHPRFAWLWLSRPSTLLNGSMPIEMLRADQLDEVIQAAREHAKTLNLGGKTS